MAKLIKGVHHINLRAVGTEGFEKAVSFYRDILGMEVVRTWGTDERPGIMLNTGDAVMEINGGAKEMQPVGGAIPHFALATDDVDACIEAVRAAGYQVTIEPRDFAFANCSTPDYNIRMGFCIGPCNETIEFFCEK